MMSGSLKGLAVLDLPLHDVVGASPDGKLGVLGGNAQTESSDGLGCKAEGRSLGPHIGPLVGSDDGQLIHEAADELRSLMRDDHVHGDDPGGGKRFETATASSGD